MSEKTEKPIAHLVWLQGRRGPDDVEDYYEVARPGDKCVDGSDPFPVFVGPVAWGHPDFSERAHYAEGVADLAISHRNDAEAVLSLVVAYDDLLRSYEGPSSTLFGGDVAEIDEAYDRMISAVRHVLPKPSSEPTP